MLFMLVKYRRNECNIDTNGIEAPLLIYRLERFQELEDQGIGEAALMLSRGK